MTQIMQIVLCNRIIVIQQPCAMYFVTYMPTPTFQKENRFKIFKKKKEKNLKKSVTCPSFFWYDNDSVH